MFNEDIISEAQIGANWNAASAYRSYNTNLKRDTSLYNNPNFAETRAARRKREAERAAILDNNNYKLLDRVGMGTAVALLKYTNQAIRCVEDFDKTRGNQANKGYNWSPEQRAQFIDLKDKSERSIATAKEVQTYKMLKRVDNTNNRMTKNLLSLLSLKFRENRYSGDSSILYCLSKLKKIFDVRRIDSRREPEVQKIYDAWHTVISSLTAKVKAIFNVLFFVQNSAYDNKRYQTFYAQIWQALVDIRDFLSVILPANVVAGCKGID